VEDNLEVAGRQQQVPSLRTSAGLLSDTIPKDHFSVFKKKVDSTNKFNSIYHIHWSLELENVPNIKQKNAVFSYIASKVAKGNRFPKGLSTTLTRSPPSDIKPI